MVGYGGQGPLKASEQVSLSPARGQWDIKADNGSGQKSAPNDYRPPSCSIIQGNGHRPIKRWAHCPAAHLHALEQRFCSQQGLPNATAKSRTAREGRGKDQGGEKATQAALCPKFTWLPIIFPGCLWAETGPTAPPITTQNHSRQNQDQGCPGLGFSVWSRHARSCDVQRLGGNAHSTGALHLPQRVLWPGRALTPPSFHIPGSA